MEVVISYIPGATGGTPLKQPMQKVQLAAVPAANRRGGACLSTAITLPTAAPVTPAIRSG